MRSDRNPAPAEPTTEPTTEPTAEPTTEPTTEPTAGPAASLVTRAVERSLEQRRASYVQEVQRIIDATYVVIERSGSLDPPMRDILREAGLSTPAFYRHFRSKDELLVVLLDDGRRRLAGYLEHRMAKAVTPVAQVRAWIEGVLAQAADPAAARRTRPFLANLDRLAELYGDEQRQSVGLLVDLLTEPVEALRVAAGARREDVTPEAVRRDAAAIYHLTIAVMHQHLRDRTEPVPSDLAHLVEFCRAAVDRA